ncbi:major facilitator superfamily domain-containing protein [Collybia nuda]|uniref:Major facilitator superfamily domain-containing protein n=1 Tax=Collybia nuda TaxID=64659 RepID=A0A9P6CG65_9AGAR|nr:major facilitator superfamily domain-containing protein [Collybia nuda]
MVSLRPSENDPLIPRGSPPLTNNHEVPKSADLRRPASGPLEISRSTRYGILAGIWIANFLSTLNQTLVPTMLPSISSEFNQSNQASWLGTSYLLATCTFTPLYGRLCNVLGRKGAHQTALTFTGLGILLCGFSRNMETLILARFLSGIGGGGLLTTSSIVVSDMYSMRSRGLTQSIASIFGGMGLGFGGPFGGIITDWLGWRWAFLLQLPLFFISFGLTSYNLCYVTPGKGKSAKEVLKRIDYGGSFSLLLTVGSILLFLSARYNEGLPWSNTMVIVSLVTASISCVAFFIMELFVAREPVLAPFLLKQKIPVLVGMSNFLVASCNFSIIYFFPMWFQVVLLTNASTAGLHLVPNSVGLSLGSVFAGYMMHKTGKYKMINAVFGCLPFISTVMIASLREDSGPYLSWLCIAPLGFGNAVVLQTMLIALLVRLPESQMAVGTGFGQLFRGIGQVGGVAISSALFQAKLDTELRRRIHRPDAEELILKIRQSARLVNTLPLDLRKKAQESYAVSINAVFVFAACCTMLAYLVRVPIPDKDLDSQPKQQDAAPAEESGPSSLAPSINDPFIDSPDEAVENEDDDGQHILPGAVPHRRLSAFESVDSVMDLESDLVGESARKTGAHSSPRKNRTTKIDK